MTSARHVAGRKAKWRIVAAAIEIGVEQDDLAVIGKLEIGIAGPAHRQRMRMVRREPAGRYELRRIAGGIARLGRERRVGIVALVGARIEEGAR
jgi:hypothetical protein